MEILKSSYYKSNTGKHRFFLDLVNTECISKTINNLDASKGTQQSDILTKVLKDKDLFTYSISVRFNNAMNKEVFSDELKHADIEPIYKSEWSNEKGNYRLVNILQNLSKPLERCMYDQLKYFDKILSKYHCGFQKG